MYLVAEEKNISLGVVGIYKDPSIESLFVVYMDIPVSFEHYIDVLSALVNDEEEVHISLSVITRDTDTENPLRENARMSDEEYRKLPVCKFLYPGMFKKLFIIEKRHTFFRFTGRVREPGKNSGSRIKINALLEKPGMWNREKPKTEEIMEVVDRFFLNKGITIVDRHGKEMTRSKIKSAVKTYCDEKLKLSTLRRPPPEVSGTFGGQAGLNMTFIPFKKKGEYRFFGMSREEKELLHNKKVFGKRLFITSVFCLGLMAGSDYFAKPYGYFNETVSWIPQWVNSGLLNNFDKQYFGSFLANYGFDLGVSFSLCNIYSQDLKRKITLLLTCAFFFTGFFAFELFFWHESGGRFHYLDIPMYASGIFISFLFHLYRIRNFDGDSVEEIKKI